MVPALLLTHSNQISKTKTRRKGSGIDSPHSNNQNKTGSETKAENSAPNKIEIGSKIKAGEGSEKRNSKNEIDNNRPHSNNSNNNSVRSSSKGANNKIEAGNRNRMDSSRLHSSNGHSSNASKRIATGSNKFKIESNSEPSNSEYKMTNSAGRDNNANVMSTCDRVQIRNSGKFGRSAGHAPGIPSTRAGSNVVAIAATAYPTTGTGDLLAAVITSEFTANR